MPVVRTRGVHGFTAALNASLWPRLVPSFPRLATTHDVYGLGTLPPPAHAGSARRKLVLGSGAAGRGAARLGSAWDVAWVRGPRSARALGLAVDRALGDPVLLLRTAFPELAWQDRDTRNVVLVPRYAAASRGDVRRIAARLGAVLCDPASPLEAIVRTFAGARLVLAECVHGALLADLMRVPWRPYVASADAEPFAWHDVCESLGLRYDPIVLPAPLQSPVAGAWHGLSAAFRRTLAHVGALPPHHRFAGARAATDADVDRAVAALARAVDREEAFACSDPGRVESLRDAMLERLDGLRRGTRRLSLVVAGGCAGTRRHAGAGVPADAGVAVAAPAAPLRPRPAVQPVAIRAVRSRS